jgi:hypothetical protein
VTEQALSFTQEEIDLLESAVFTAYRKEWYDGANKEHLDVLYRLRLKLTQYCSEELCR